MSMDFSSIIVSLIFGTLGFAFFVYGKKNASFRYMLVGSP